MTQVAMDDNAFATLRSNVLGEVITPESPGFDAARRVWNGMIDRRPALLVRCTCTEDVVAAVNFGRETGLVVSIRGGSHSTPGYSTCDDGIVIDLSAMTAVKVDPDARTARVQGGAQWAHLDAATQEHGLAVTGGRISGTGVGGLSLGSGSGWLERAFGVTCESLRAAQVVTADGSVVTAGEHENPDLLWGLRGGGGNFGIVTEFEFGLHEVGPIVMAGMLAFPRPQGGEVLRAYRDFMRDAPNQLCGALALMTAPPEEFVPEPARGQPAVGVIFLFVGPVEDGAVVAQSLRDALPDPVVDLIQPMPYAALQTMLDAGNPHGIREYFKIEWLEDLPDDAIDLALQHAEALPGPFAQIIFAPMGGAVGHTDPSTRALRIPDAKWSYFALTMWMDPSEDESNIEFTRAFASVMQPYSTGATMPNFMGADDPPARLAAGYGEANYQRLVELKRKWDPDNLFRLNQNIAPG